MQYPIFNSIIKKIESELQGSGINPVKFRVWKDTTIHAIGLEMGIDVSDEKSGIREISINFDWDKYREVKMARQLKGMNQHPLLNKETLPISSIIPTIDVEISWNFDEVSITNNLRGATNDGRLEYASTWMKNINEHLNEILPTEKLISRWHLDVETDYNGKYVSSMSLITYFQYSLKNVDDINDIHTQISARLHTILNRSGRILKLAKNSRPVAA
jgi:hypothetical protein